MACRGFFDCLLRLLNFVLALAGLAIFGYGVYLLVLWLRVSAPAPSQAHGPDGSISPLALPHALLLPRPVLAAVSFSAGDGFLDSISRAWFIWSLIGIGVAVFVMSLFGCIGASMRNGCCLSFYSALIILLIVVELAVGSFIFFYHNWRDVVPVDETGNLDMIFHFLKNNWKIVKWVALGIALLEALAFMLVLAVQAANSPSDCDSDDDIIAPRSGARQPLVNRQNAPPSAMPSLDYRPIRNDAWSQRMRQKYGADNLQFNQSDPTRLEQYPAEQKRCVIL